MTKTKTAAKGAAKKTETKPDHDPTTWARTLRETVESVVIAFILAFLFRTFEAEAFVIPTGSMAPTLQGRHKDIVCPKCGYEYRTGASQEVDDGGAAREGCFLDKATCPFCRYTADVGPGDGYPSYSGDRIIVSKFAYDLSDPERWDVIVFKYPEDSKQNYIKRLVGLPNERLRVEHGDIFTAPLGSNDFVIERKGKKPRKLLAMLQPVYNNDYVVEELLKAGFPARWQPWVASGQSSPWAASDNTRSFEIDGKNTTPAWLRYQHFLPTPAVWNAVQKNEAFTPPQPSLIQDFYAYNDGDFVGCRNHDDRLEWVGDLAFRCNLEVKSNQGTIVLELVKSAATSTWPRGKQHYRSPA
jgi:signal peptidase I